MKVRKNPREILRKFIGEAEGLCKKWMNSTQQYPAHELVKTPVKAAVNRRSIESVASQSSKTASADTTIRAIPKLRQQDLEEFVSQRYVELLSRFLPRLRGKVWLVIDFHHEARYGKEMVEDTREMTYLSRINKQIQQVTSYATLAIVSLNGKYTVPLTVALSMNYKGRSRVAVIGDLLDTFSRHFEFKIEYLLLDGGLMSKAVISMLDARCIPFIGRWWYSSKSNYPETPSFLISMQNCSAYGYLLNLPTPQGGSESCLLYSSAQYPALDPAEAHAIYRARFRIENTYRHSRRFKLRTASSSAGYYFYLWSFGQFLECLWELLRLVVQILGASSAFACQDWVADLFVEVLSFCC